MSGAEGSGRRLQSEVVFDGVIRKDAELDWRVLRSDGMVV